MPPQVGAGVAAVVFNPHGQLLVLRRKGAHGAGSWSVPGGWMEVGETPFTAAARELHEETGLSVDRDKGGTVLDVTNDYFKSENVHSVCFFVRVRLAPGTDWSMAKVMEPGKASDLEWVYRRDLLPRPIFLPLALLLAGAGEVVGNANNELEVWK